MKVASFTSLAGIAVDREAVVPLHRQLYEAIRGAILGGRLGAGARLPSMRTLASELGLSRNTVTRAYEQLASEGYVVATIGSGTRVTDDLPDAIPQHISKASQVAPPAGLPSHRLSGRGAWFTDPQRSSNRHFSYFLDPPPFRPFCPALPALDAFPTALWGRTLAASWRTMETSMLGYRSPAGYGPLREAIAEHVRTARGVRCEPEQVIITTGTQQALSLVASLLVSEGDCALVEDPGFGGIRALLAASGVRMVPVPVDHEGMMIDVALERARGARLAHISPSHQYPLGATMSVGRRIQILEWAHETGAWILEDDYDSEFRYAGYPLQALQGLDNGGRVIYLGTFSKSMFPALRIGFAIVPKPLVRPMRAALAYADRSVNLLSQVALASFLEEGHFARHIRKMRSLYARRRRVLDGALKERLHGLLAPETHHTGMHLLAWLPAGVSDAEVSRKLRDAGIEAPALSNLSEAPLARNGLILGFTTPEDDLVAATGTLEQVLRNAIRGSGQPSF